MKKFTVLLPALLLAAWAPVTAQDAAVTPAAPAPVLRHDVSLFTQQGRSFTTDGTIGALGIVYRWSKPRAAQTFWKFGLGAGSSFDIAGQRILPVSADSAVAIELWQQERVYLMLAGAETQRQLWRNFYLTAGLEGQAGGSGGGIDSVTRQVPTDASQPYNGDIIGSPVRLADTRRYFGTGLALLGVLAYAGRFTTALELFTGFQVAARQEIRNASDATVFDFGIGRSGGRFSVGYRF